MAYNNDNQALIEGNNQLESILDIHDLLTLQEATFSTIGSEIVESLQKKKEEAGKSKLSLDEISKLKKQFSAILKKAYNDCQNKDNWQQKVAQALWQNDELLLKDSMQENEVILTIMNTVEDIKNKAESFEKQIKKNFKIEQIDDITIRKRALLELMSYLSPNNEAALKPEAIEEVNRVLTCFDKQAAPDRDPEKFLIALSKIGSDYYSFSQSSECEEFLELNEVITLQTVNSPTVNAINISHLIYNGSEEDLQGLKYRIMAAKQQEITVFPLNIRQQHWVSIIIDKRSAPTTCTLIDTLTDKKNGTSYFMRDTEQLVKESLGETTKVNRVTAAVQTGCSCGVWTACAGALYQAAYPEAATIDNGAVLDKLIRDQRINSAINTKYTQVLGSVIDSSNAKITEGTKSLGDIATDVRKESIVAPIQITDEISTMDSTLRKATKVAPLEISSGMRTTATKLKPKPVPAALPNEISAIQSIPVNTWQQVKTSLTQLTPADTNANITVESASNNADVLEIYQGTEKHKKLKSTIKHQANSDGSEDIKFSFVDAVPDTDIILADLRRAKMIADQYGEYELVINGAGANISKALEIYCRAAVMGLTATFDEASSSIIQNDPQAKEKLSAINEQREQLRLQSLPESELRELFTLSQPAPKPSLKP